MSADPRPVRLRVGYLTGLRPATAPPADPQFVWNGVPMEGGWSEQEPFGSFTRVTASFDLPAPLVSVVNQLLIRSTPWRGHGILLDRVTLQRVSVDG